MFYHFVLYFCCLYAFLINLCNTSFHLCHSHLLSLSLSCLLHLCYLLAVCLILSTLSVFHLHAPPSVTQPSFMSAVSHHTRSFSCSRSLGWTSAGFTSSFVLNLRIAIDRWRVLKMFLHCKSFLCRVITIRRSKKRAIFIPCCSGLYLLIQDLIVALIFS